MGRTVAARRAGTIDARLAARDDALELVIRDDGSGFDPGIRAVGRGLDGMRRRTSELGGMLVIDSAPGRGTTIRTRAPVTVDA